LAQNTPAPDAEATMRLGPLSLKSTIGLSNVGVDSNVFNAADTDHPQSDFTMTFTPTTNLWLRLGDTWLSGNIHVDWVYYRKFASERAANSNYKVGVTRAFNRLAIRAGASRLNTRDRPGFEIDARSERNEASFDGEVEVRVRSLTSVGAKVWRRDVDFDRDAVFRGASLADELNRTSAGQGVAIRHHVTPLTRLSLEAGRDHDRFAFSRLRDSDSTRITGSVHLEPLALISGDASIGYRRFTPVSADVPPYRGSTAAVNLVYTLLGTTRLGFEAARDVQPSFEVNQPYYLETGATGSLQRRVYGPFDVLARIGGRRLAYRDRTGVPVEISHRTDRVRTFGVGAGYRLGTDKRIGFTIDQQRRRSSVEGHQYAGVRIGMSLTYTR
jgi:hypothetical protein